MKNQKRRNVMGWLLGLRPSTAGLAQQPFRPAGQHRPARRSARSHHAQCTRACCRRAGRRGVAAAVATTPVRHRDNAGQGGTAGFSPRQSGDARGVEAATTAAPVTGDSGGEVVEDRSTMVDDDG
jgi:hypothetical protein